MTLTLPDDLATWTYIAGFIIKGWGFLLFLWWWDKARRNDAHTSTVFIYVMVILLGTCVRDGIDMYAGYCRATLELTAPEMKEYVYDVWFWPGRMIIENLAFAALVIHMSVRALWQREK